MRDTKTRLLAAVLVLVLGATVGACNSDDDPNDGSTTTQPVGS